ncbi:MAG: 50S ribosomal protein L11 methyltransferase [Desulfobacteraceae bacterium]
MTTESDARRKGNSGPYGDLFIYHLKGQVKEEEELSLGEHFQGNWVEGDASFLFFSVPSNQTVLKLIERRSDMELIEDYRFTYEQWQGSSLKPLLITDFVVHPPWEEVDTGDKETEIILDPGMVFGTGLHPTTQDCLKAMVHVREKTRLKSVLDLGTGTGILALAAALLGAEKVKAVDLNPLSVKTAQRNVRLNGLEESIEVVEGSAEDFVEEKADLVLANLHHSVIVKLLNRPGFLEKTWHVISGLLRSQVREIRYKLGELGLPVIREWEQEGTWYTLLVRNDNERGRKWKWQKKE